MALQSQEASVALLIDCDNVPPDIAEFALQKAVQAGRLTVRRGYGTTNSLKNWDQVLMRQSFTTFLQLPHASKKNTTDIALALDALELLLDGRAQAFCLVTGDSDFAYLCRKLRERGATVYVAGDAQSPEALRNACDQFFEWAPKAKSPPKAPTATATAPPPKAAPVAKAPKQAVKKAAASGARPKQSPAFFRQAVEALAPSAPKGRVTLHVLVDYIRRTAPTFKSNVYGHATLVTMAKAYPELRTQKEANGEWSVSLVPKATEAKNSKK